MDLITSKKQGLLTVFVLLVLVATSSRFVAEVQLRRPTAEASQLCWSLEEVGTSGYESTRFRDINQRVQFRSDEFVITNFSRRQDFYSWEMLGNDRAEAYFLEGAKGVLDRNGRMTQVNLGADSADLLARLEELKRAMNSDSKPAWVKIASSSSEQFSASPWSLFFEGKQGPRIFSFRVNDRKNERLINLISEPFNGRREL